MEPTSDEIMAMSEDELFVAALKGHLGYQPRARAVCVKMLLEGLVSPARAEKQLARIAHFFDD